MTGPDRFLGTPPRYIGKPKLVPCHQGCEVQIGIVLPACGLLLDTVDHPAELSPGAFEMADTFLEAWTEEVRCGLRAGHGDPHDAKGQAIAWSTSIPRRLEVGKTFAIRARHRDEGMAGAWSEGTKVRVAPNAKGIDWSFEKGQPNEAI